MGPEKHDPLNWDCSDGGIECFAVDVWSFRIVSLECYLEQQKARYGNDNLHHLLWRRVTIESPETMPSECRGFLRRCLEKDWKKRGSVSELLGHPSINNGSCDSNE